MGQQILHHDCLFYVGADDQYSLADEQKRRTRRFFIRSSCGKFIFSLQIIKIPDTNSQKCESRYLKLNLFF